MSAFPPPTGPADGRVPGGSGPAAAGRSGPSYGRALLATLVWPALNLVALFALLGAPGSPRAGGEITGSLLLSSLLAALITWRVARRVTTRSFWQLALLALPFYLVLRLLGAVGGAAG